MQRIVISMRKSVDKHQEVRDCLSDDWSSYLTNLDPSLILFPLINQPHLVNPTMDFIKPHGLILTNGDDLHSNEERDLTEFKAIEYADSRNIPILGVCRGMQVLNYFFGGHIENQIEGHITHNHKIELVRNQNFSQINATTIEVNSYHNQGVNISGLSSQFCSLAFKGDFVEFIHHKTKSIMGIQWHPERKNKDQNATDDIVRSFLSKTVKEIDN